LRYVSAAEAGDLLREGRVGLVPTETVVGLVVGKAGLSRLFEIKGRDPGKPIAVLGGSAEEALALGRGSSPLAQSLADRFWPGPLTLVLEAEGVVVLKVGNALLGVRGDAPETSSGERFDAFHVGLDHLALAVESPEQLREMQDALDAAGVRNEGIQDDSSFNAKALVFYDPDGIALELYAMVG